MNRLKTLSCVCVLLIFAEICYGKDWRGIIPLRSTRRDVARILGKPLYKTAFGAVYQKGNQRVLVTFSKGRCQENSAGWNVPDGLVVLITVYPPENVTLDDLKLDLNKYRTFLDIHYRILNYFDDEEGFSIAALEHDKRVMFFDYYPGAKDKHLQCVTHHLSLHNTYRSYKVCESRVES
jgi:hypothetical protein